MNRIWCSNCSELRITALHSSISCTCVYLLRYKKKWLHSFQRWKHDNCIDIDYWSKRYWKRNHSNIAADLHLGRDSSQLVLQIQLSTETQEKWVSQSSGTSLVQGKKNMCRLQNVKTNRNFKVCLVLLLYKSHLPWFCIYCEVKILCVNGLLNQQQIHSYSPGKVPKYEFWLIPH